MSAPTPSDPADDVSLSWALPDQPARVPTVATTTDIAPTTPDSVVSDAALIDGLVGQIHDALPASWSSYLVELAIADTEHRTRAVAETPDGRLLPIVLGVQAVQMAAGHRQMTSDPAPWMWLRVTQNRGESPRVTSFDGFVGAPPEHLLFPPASYLRDISMATDVAIPLWLHAYTSRQGSQLRTATAAADVAPTEVIHPTDELPPLDLLWSRFAALASVFASINAFDGPRMNAATGIFRGDLGGCTLNRLPGGRAVLSGGADHSPLMTAAYTGTVTQPDLYRGAPEWVSNIVLDDRVHTGMLSFCYWWSDGRWSRADVRGPAEWSAIDEISPAVPGVWTTDITAELVRVALAQAGVELPIEACTRFVNQVDAGSTRPDLLTALDHPAIAAAEGLTVLDLGQPW